MMGEETKASVNRDASFHDLYTSGKQSSGRYGLERAGPYVEGDRETDYRAGVVTCRDLIHSPAPAVCARPWSHNGVSILRHTERTSSRNPDADRMQGDDPALSPSTISASITTSMERRAAGRSGLRSYRTVRQSCCIACEDNRCLRVSRSDQSGLRVLRRRVLRVSTPRRQHGPCWKIHASQSTQRGRTASSSLSTAIPNGLVISIRLLLHHLTVMLRAMLRWRVLHRCARNTLPRNDVERSETRVHLPSSHLSQF